MKFDANRIENTSELKTIQTLLRYTWPKNRSDLKVRIILAMLCLVLGKLINVYVPFLFKYAIDSLSIENPSLMITIGLVTAYGSARLLQQSFGELRDFIFAKVAQHTQRIIALETFRHLHALSLRFHLERQTGGLSRVIDRGTKGIIFLMQFMVFNIIPTILELLLVTVILFFTFKPIFAITTFLTIVIYVTFTLLITNWRIRFRKTMMEKDSEANTKAIDSLLNYETVKYFNNEKHEFQRYDHSMKGYELASIQNQTSLSLLNFTQGLIISVGLVIAMSLAAQGVIQKTMSLGDFVLVNTFLMQLYLPLNFLGFIYREIKQCLVDMDKMFELLDVYPEIKDAPSALPINIQGGSLQFKNVHFSYQKERLILDDVDFTVPAGKTVALVGPSGSGKSTIARLIYRFYDVQEGAILIDGQNINSITQNSLRNAIGIVPQDTVLFNDTLEYNIQYGKIGANHAEVQQAAQMAELQNFIELLPEKYATKVGERGLKLSGGEKQRVAIARTILKNPHILIFDEATSALDSKTEKEIQRSLKKVSKNRTTLIIAHRLSTVIDADQIIVLKAGKIIEKGTHTELLQRKGEYAEMWFRQLEENQNSQDS